MIMSRHKTNLRVFIFFNPQKILILGLMIQKTVLQN